MVKDAFDQDILKQGLPLITLLLLVKRFTNWL